MKCTGDNLSFLCTLASMMIGPGDSGSSIFRGFLISIALLPGRPSLNILWGTRIVLFLVCPFMRFPPPRGRGRGGSKGWMGLVTPSDFSTPLPFDFIPCEGNDLLGQGILIVCVCMCWRLGLWGGLRTVLLDS
jgi:hypothetical protein